ncbi:hypothetical protein UPYG_G00062550 [Umbra pygmaea]|uniref:Ig-like domain-containing protein n=1 Tax=Umbra pygmaea TaxID=75934 RepID=A0ABD0X9Q2_UMBPY
MSMKDFIMCQSHSYFKFLIPHRKLYISSRYLPYPLKGDKTMSLKSTGIVLNVLCSVAAATMATTCVRTTQVMLSPNNTVWGQAVTLTCNDFCILGDNNYHTYIWYYNGEPLVDITAQRFSNTSYYTHSYSCAVKGFEDLRSPAVCVLGTSCMNVTYTHQSISALIGSTVDLPCKYQHPENNTVIEQNWYIQNQSDNAPRNLSSVPEYTGRVEYLGNNKTDCTLRIRDLRVSDSAEYKFRFKTIQREWGYSFPGTTLTVEASKKGVAVAVGITLAVLVLVLLLCFAGFMCLRKKASKSTSDSRDPSENKQRDSSPVYDNASGMAMASNRTQTVANNNQAELHYASVQLPRSKNQEVPLYSSAQLHQPQKQEEDVQYAAVKFNCPSAATQSLVQEAEQELSVLYTTVNTPRTKTT